MASSLQPTEAQRDTAAAWLIRQDGGAMTAAEQAEMTAWLRADPRHQLAWHQARMLWGQLEVPARPLAVRAAARLVPLARAGRRSRPLRMAGWAIAACASLLLLWSALPDLTGLAQNLTANAWTPHGQNRAVALPDGSTVTLAGNSAIRLTFDGKQRHVRLLRGTAFFDVRPGLTQPFIVEAGSAWARVVGTRFDVQRHGDTVQVAVEHGLVDVGGLPDNGSLRLPAGKAADIVAGRLGAAKGVDLGAVTAWRDGRMVFYRDDLAAVVARLQDQRGGRIVIADPALARRKVSGAFPGGDIDGTVTAIADTLGVKAVRLTPWLTILY